MTRSVAGPRFQPTPWTNPLPRFWRTAAEFQFGMNLLAGLILFFNGSIGGMTLGLVNTVIGRLLITGPLMKSPTHWWTGVIVGTVFGMILSLGFWLNS